MVWEALKEEKQDDVLVSMKEYMEFCQDGAGYTEADITRCGEILDEYIDRLSQVDDPDAGAILLYVEKVVRDLNELNDECNYSLIETDQRELLCDFIEKVAQEAGLENDGTDITEEWREW